MAGKYDDLSRDQLIELLEKHDRTKKLGLVWERDEINADRAMDHDFIAAQIDHDLSDKPAPWENLIIEGDNYDALRWLRMTHAGRVKCIYIDPPYNTGNKDWVYNDRYMSADDRFRQSTWLEFLYRRLTLARDLLDDDGVILISINDDQRALLELMADEALTGMRLGSFVWRTRVGGNEGGQHFFTSNQEHVLAFAKAGFRFGGTKKSFDMYRFFDEVRQDHFRISDLTVAVGYDNPRAGTAYYPLYDPDAEVWYPCNPNRVWSFVSKALAAPGTKVKTKFMEDWIKEGRIRFPEIPRVQVWETEADLRKAVEAGDVPKSGNTLMIHPDLPGFAEWVGKRVAFGTPGFKRYKSELKNPTQPLSSWIVPKSEAETLVDNENQITSGTNDEGAKSVRNVFGSKAFDYAKPVSLIQELVQQSTSPGDLVLDFFAGSATTAQAVMELNATDSGDRRFIMVSSTEATESEPDKNVCRDVTAERVRRLNTSDDEKYANLAAGFAYLRTVQIPFEDLDYDLEPKDAWTALEAFHDLPLTAYDTDAPWNIHEADDLTLVMVDRFEPALLDWLKERAMQNLHVYAWAPGQITQHLDEARVQVASIRDTLVRAFRA